MVSAVPIESIAQAIHVDWRQEAIANGDTAPAWQDLDESRKESSRGQASHIPAHLGKVGCAIAPLRDWEAGEFTFTAPEIKLLSIAEHERWNRERSADGWTLAAEKNVERKQTPYLLPAGRDNRNPGGPHDSRRRRLGHTGRR